MSAHTSLGAHTSAHMSLDAHTSAHISLGGHTLGFWSDDDVPPPSPPPPPHRLPSLCLSKKVCVGHRESVSATEILCLSHIVCFCHIQSGPVTDSLSVSQTVFVSQFVSLSDTLHDNSWPCFYLFIHDFHQDLSERFEFGRNLDTNGTNFVEGRWGVRKNVGTGYPGA